MNHQSPTLASQATAELPGLPDRAPRLHRLKTDPEVYQAVLAGRKTFEIRLNDRDFRIGDELLLMETTFTGEAIRVGAPLQFTGNEMRKRVSHVLSGYGLMPGWVCLSFAGYEAGRASRAQSEWQTPPASWRLLAKAAIELLCAIDAKHDTERPPTKYSVPYGAVNQLRSALGCAEDQPATLGETK